MGDSVQKQNNNKKRPLENGHFNNNINNNNNNINNNNNYFKIRAIAKDIRPHFIQVLKTPEFRTCAAAQEIQNQLKLIMDLYKEMMRETILTRCTNTPETNTALSGEKQEKKKDKEEVNVEAEKLISSGNISKYLQSEDGRPQGTFIVGGSAAGWNFITYPGGMVVYYGRTKEMFRAESAVVTDDLPKGA